MIILFFSSRSRHTSWPRDWSSDVCSSDLLDELAGSVHHLGPAEVIIKDGARGCVALLSDPEIGRASSSVRVRRSGVGVSLWTKNHVGKVGTDRNNTKE